MRLYLASVNPDEIRWAVQSGLIDGVVATPRVLAEEVPQADPLEILTELAALTPLPIFASVGALTPTEIVRGARALRRIAEQVVIAIPFVEEALPAVRRLSRDGVRCAATFVHSAAQGLLAAKAGAAYISPFVGRLDDIGTDGMQLIADICQIYRAYPAIRTEVLVASVRHPIHVVAAAKLGAHVATLPPNVLRQMYQHPLTDKGLAAFLADWQKTGQSILG